METRNEIALYALAKAFYQAYRVSGRVKLTFGIRGLDDSDGNSVLDAYLSPQDQEASATLKLNPHSGHLQFLEPMVPANLLGYQFILNINPIHTNQIQVETMEILPPFSAKMVQRAS